MKNTSPWLRAMAILAAAVCAYVAPAAPVTAAEEGESEVKKADVPEKVLAAVKARFPKGEIGSVSKEKEKDVLLYEVEVVQDGRTFEVEVNENGKIIEIEEEGADDADDDDDDDDDDDAEEKDDDDAK